jgi:hypothetical protein
VLLDFLPHVFFFSCEAATNPIPRSIRRCRFLGSSAIDATPGMSRFYSKVERILPNNFKYNDIKGAQIGAPAKSEPHQRANASAALTNTTGVGGSIGWA